MTAIPLLALLLLLPSAAAAQETRGAVIAAAQAEKATRLAPRAPTAAERMLQAVRHTLLEEPSGWYPYFDSVYSGGGFTLGAGYRQFTGDRTHWNVAGLYSMKGYKLIEASALSPGHFDRRVGMSARAGWRDATQVPYHGLGIDSPADPGAAFRMQQAYVGADLTVRSHRGLYVRAGLAYEDFTLADPSDGLSAVDDTYTAVTAPGVGASPAYFHTTASAGLDWRPASDYARRGGLYEVSHHHYSDRGGTYSFSRLDAEVVQHLPILRDNWVVSLRGLLQTTTNGDDQVPYFLMPSLGSGSTLRGYSSWRFRDRHAALASAEFRWIVNRLALDMALFYDAGTVGAEIDQITLGSLVSDVGIGARFHGPISTPLRIELARGSEGVRLVFAASAAF